MVRTRQNVWELPRAANGWSDTMLWYARGVAAMKAKPIADTTSWRSYAAIHGLDRGLWTQYGYLAPGEPLPSPADQARYWLQCQHGSWYFLPWHRGYLVALEANIQAAIATMPGAPANWSLPYWNYFKPGQNRLPPEFATPNWPDGTGNNPLFVTQRWGPNNDGNVFIPMNQVNLNAMGLPRFIGGATGGSPGFGGPVTGFSHGGRTHGGLESQPHDMVHVFTGGANPQNPNMPGLMSYPPTAGLDPIFYLHHANIDRLWQAWNVNNPPRANPTDPNWTAGPTRVGQRGFSMPMPGGNGWNYTPDDMVNIARLGYQYDTLAPAGVAFARPLGSAIAEGAAVEGAVPVAEGSPTSVELVGASGGKHALVGSRIRTAVAMDSAVRKSVARSRGNFAAMAESAGASATEHVFLNLENVVGLADATAFQVYLNLPEGGDPAQHPELLAGQVALFGVKQASDPDGEHGGQGLNFVLDITDIVDTLNLHSEFDADDIQVDFVPNQPVAEAAQIQIGRVSIVRESE